jgi:Tfp pilus assembly protein PilF
VRDAAEGIERIEQKIAAIGAADWGACFDGPNGEQRIAACGRLIASGKLGNGDLAQAYFQRAVNMVVIRAELDQSLADLNEAIRLDPSQAPAHAIRAARFIRTGNLDRALADLNEAKRLNPNSGTVHNAFGLYYIAIGDYDRALVEFNDSLRLFPQFLYAYKNRAVTYEHKGELAAALADFRTALSMDPAKKEIGGKEAAEGIARIEALAGSAALADKRVALVVGNSAYKNVTPLDNPAHDAKLMADTLRSLGFMLVGDGAQLDLDKAAFDGAVESFGNRLQGADVGLFYYAGHGVQVRGINYLVPVGANLTKEADVDFQMLDSNLVLRQMESAGTKLNIVILDACRNNPFGGRSLRGGDRGLAQMQAPEGTLISFATQPGNVAQDGAAGNSPYTMALAQTLRRPGLDIFQTFNEVGLAVMQTTSNSQQPWVSSSPIRGNFYFAGRATGMPPPAAATP